VPSGIKSGFLVDVSCAFVAGDESFLAASGFDRNDLGSGFGAQRGAGDSGHLAKVREAGYRRIHRMTPVVMTAVSAHMSRMARLFSAWVSQYCFS
jgi:hypothetical protein